MRLVWLVGLLLAGCGDPAAGDDSGGAASPGWDTASPWTRHDPELDAAQVGERMDAILAVGLPASPALMASFDALIAEGDEGVCGGAGRNMQYPMSGCTTSSGWEIGGLIFYEVGDGGSYSAQGDLFAVDPEGNRWIGAGDVQYDARGEDDWYFDVSGTWGYVHDTGWPGAQPSLAMAMDVTPAGVTIEGGYMPYEEAMYFDDVVGEADGTVSGTVSLRDPLGDWYALALGSDGCGTITWGSEALGETCAALAPAVAELLVRGRDPQ